MKCEYVRELFSEYYDDETELSEKIALHLDECQSCSSEYEEYRSLLADVASLDEPDVPDGFRASLVSYADGFYRGRKKHISITSHRFVSVFGSMAAAAAAVLFVWFSSVFDTGAGMYERPEMLAEFAVPQAASETLYDYYEVFEDFPAARRFDFGDASYDYVSETPYLWHYMTVDEFTGEGVSAFVMPESDYFGFFEPIIIEVGYMGSPVIRPRFATAVLFLIIGLFLGFNLHRLAKYIERKSDNAP